MTDVLRIALERRDKLQAEIDRLDEFIRTAEKLIRESHPAPRPVADEPETSGSARMNLLRRNARVAVG